jgi:nicotinamide-nucleotide adenylyltransferase
MKILTDGGHDITDEDSKRVALFIGRFQPFHKGHLFMIKRIFADFNEVIIGIGSAQYSNTKDNPFTIEERVEMIQRALKEHNLKDCTVIPIEDLHNDGLWAGHVEKLVPRFNAVFTHDPLTRRLFSDKDYDVVEVDLHEREHYSGTEVRRRMERGEDWMSLVPKEVAKYLRDIKAEDRVRLIAAR